MAAHLILLLFLPIAYAQFIQRYNLVNGKPHWRRQIGNNFVNREVLQPEYPVYLEYNCHAMPAICNNVNSWINDPQKNTWPGRPGTWVFNYDMYASTEKQYSQGTKSTKPHKNREHRRAWACEEEWRVNKHTCPEPGQPQVMAKTGAWPHTALENANTRNAPLEIEAIRLNGQISQRSQRVYSCDEFPPASWVEGGIGLPNNIPPEGNNGKGTTYCAPFGSPCGGGKKIASEQDWQGSAHFKLYSRLVRQIDGKYRKENQKDQKKTSQNKFPLQEDHIVQFHLRLTNTNDNAAVRIRYKDYTKNEADDVSQMNMFKRNIRIDFPSNLTFYERATLGEQMTERDWIDYGYVSDTIEHVDFSQLVVRYADGSVELEDGTMMSAFDYESMRHSHHNSDTSPQPRSLHNNSTPETVPLWNTNSSDVYGNLTSDRLETHQEPNGDAIDIIGLSAQYIRAQISDSNATESIISQNKNSSHHQVARRPHGQHRHGHSHGHSHGQISPRRSYSLDPRAVDGPIQCGEGSPCKDGSCCNKDGKCGFKEAQCGANCISNCDAKAMCGIDSVNGATKCGLNLCCSYYGWCGTETVHCLDPEPQYAKTPCQQGYGACAITPKPSCGKGSGTSGGRRVGYYQGWNTRERSCDKVRPSQINTKGLTHLYYAFVFFHPTTFEIVPMNDADIPLYKEFTDLKTNKLQTWVAIGGWSFNEPESPTATAFSDMVSTSANRAAFIKSLIAFMDMHGFQGADIDWEYPAEPKRGGRPEDSDNLVALMKDMRAAFGTRYGLSIVLAPDYWYLRGFKPAAMQRYVDHMGFMSYDLHGPWDTDVKTLGSLVRPQTDITEIDKGLTPLWFDGVDPSKINMGIAYYGRSYKLADPSCGKMGCSFIPKQGGAPGRCTNSAGVMSNREIRQLIKDDGITPTLNETAMIKYFTYGGDSWIGYDDEETYAMKEAFANDRCLGGIMIWSIDFDAETGGVGNETADGLIWIDPEIWEQPTPTVQCFFPCTMVLPPYPADKVTTIDYPRLPVTTNGAVAGTLTFAPLTVSEYALSMMTVSGGNMRRQEPVITTRPEISTTTTWPVKYWTDGNGDFYSTRASMPALKFPPSGTGLPQYASLHVVNGPPSPTVSECAFSAHICEPKQTGDNREVLALRLTRGAVAKGPGSLEDIFLHILPGEIEEEDEPAVCLANTDDEQEEDNPDDGEPADEPGEGGGAEPPDVVVPPPVELPPWALAPLLPLFFPGHPWANNTATTTVPFQTPMPASPTGPTATMPFEAPIPAQTASVDFSQDKKPSCYNSGLKANRKDLIEHIDYLCRYYDQALSEINSKTLPAGLYQIDRNFKADGQEYTDYVTTFEIMDFCKWDNFSFDDCGREFRKIVDGCNTKGENGKQGGTLQSGNCMKWRVDPNKEVYHAPKS